MSASRLWSAVLGALVVAAATRLATGAPAETITQTISFEHESMTFWSGLMAPWGLDKVPDWVIAEGGKPGKALRITGALSRRPACCEVRTIQSNHQPGTAARIQLDVNPVVHPRGSSFRIRWFDGYVSAETFETIADEEFDPFPPALYEIAAPPERPGWQHVDLRTPPLQHTVLTLAFMISQPEAEPGGGPQRCIDYLLDNLSVETVPLPQLMDPGFDWQGKGGSTMVHWRRTTEGAHVDWCDFMEETDLPWPDGSGRVLHFTLDSFRDHGLSMLFHKHDFGHETAMVDVGGASVIALARNQPGHVPASFGVRQTVSYASLGLAPDEEAHLEATIKCTVLESGLYRGAVQAIGVLQLGCDPAGGLETENALWTERDQGGFWGREGWTKLSLEWDRPKGASAFTIFFRYRDGECRSKHSIDCATQPRVTYLGSRGMADWIVIKATKH